MLRKITALFLSLSLIITQPIFAQGVAQLNLAQYLGQARLSAIDNFRPTQLRYFSYDNLNDSFRILLDKGDAKDIKDNQLKQEAKELMDYFLIGLALPNDAFWVNLRPDSPDNIIDPELERTDLGKILLEADLQLKKDTAGLTSPQTPEGKAYWDKLYKKAGELFPAAGGSAFGGGTENITIPTITRPWIVPGEIIVRESGNSAYIYKATLKVLLEQDHLKDSSVYNFSDPRLKELNEYSSQIIKETIIPKLTQEVNSSKRYAQLRQVYYSLVLSRWFKQKYSSLRSARASARQGTSADYISLIDSGNLTNLTAKKPYDKLTYFKQYQESFAKGEYNLKEPVYTPYGQSIRTYMSGGFNAGNKAMIISGVGTIVVSSIVGKSLENRANTVPLEVSGNNGQVTFSKQGLPLSIAASPVVLSESEFLTNMNNILSEKDISPEKAFIELIDGLSRLEKGTVLTNAIGTVCLILSVASENKNEIKWLFSVMEKSIYGVYIQKVTLRHETISVEEILKRIGIELELNSGRLDREKEGDFIKECRRINNRFIAVVKNAQEAIAKQGRSSVASSVEEFKTEGINSNESIDALKELTGITIEEIEYRARPGVYSQSGFISRLESFKDVLKKDNTFVLGKNLTHQKLAIPLLKALECCKYDSGHFEYNKIKFMVKATIYRGMQGSIFNEGRTTNADYVVTNTISGKTISFSGLIPYYVNDYGFYEGSVNYRLEPKDIIDFFVITASSGLTSESQSSVPFGGIDFTNRAMKIGLEPMGSFADLKLVLPEVSNAAAIDLDNEFKQIQLMASSGIRPSDERILEFAAASYYRGEFGPRMGEITSCLQQAHFLDERLGRESSEALRLATMLPEVM